MDDLIEANNEFALDLYNRFSGSGENVFFSPYSISTALGMALEGAKGETADEMKDVLHFEMDDASRRAAVEELYALLNPEDASYKLHTANDLWAQDGYALLEDYVDVLTGSYGGDAHTVDFENDCESAREEINAHIEDLTNDKIKELLKPGVVDELTRLVLTNAIYFKGDWKEQFDKKNTFDEDFYLSDGSTVEAPLMRKLDSDFMYAAQDGVQAIRLDYEGDELSMLVLLPEDMGEFEKGLDVETIRSLRDSMMKQQVHLYLPKFTFTANYGLGDTLQQMGMPTAFSSNADFSGIDGLGGLAISDVIHQAFVDVNEEGTEAAAATAVVFRCLSAMPVPIPEFRADKPFLFVIQENATGNYLFMGKVENPAE